MRQITPLNQQAYDLRREGYTYAQIGKLLGVCPDRARQHVKRVENLKRISTGVNKT